MMPKDCRMPNLDSVDPSLIRCLAPKLLGGDGNEKVNLFLRNYARLIDLAIDEYQRARQSCIYDIEDLSKTADERRKNGHTVYILAFANHFEFCINATARIIKNLKGIKSNNKSPQIDRVTRKFIEAISQDFIEARNAVEHMDEEIQGNKSGNGNPVFPTFAADDTIVKVGKREIKVTNLATLLEKLHQIGYQMITGEQQIQVEQKGVQPCIKFPLRIENGGKNWY